MMTTPRNSQVNVEESECRLKVSKDMVHIFEAVTVNNTCKSKTKPPVPSINDTIKISNTDNINPSIQKGVHQKHCNEHSFKKTDLNKSVQKEVCDQNTKVPSVKDTIKIVNSENINPSIQKAIHLKNHCNGLLFKKEDLNKSTEEKVSDKNTKVNKTKLFIEKKKKERAEKNKLDLLQKKKFAEERKRKLAELQKTTRELAEASFKKRTIHVQDECSLNLPIESNQPELDQTWLPPPKVKIVSKKTLKILINVQEESIKDLETMYYDKNNICLNISKNEKKIHLPASEKVSNYAKIIPQTDLTEKKPEICDDIKSKNVYSTLKFNDDYQLIDNGIFDFSIPKLINTNIQNYHENGNVKCLEDCHNDEKHEKELGSPNDRDTSYIKLRTKPIDVVNVDTPMYTDIQLPIQSHDQIINRNDHLFERQELLLNQCSPNNTCYSELTLTGSHTNVVSLFSSETHPPPPLNFISVLKCKKKLQKKENIDLEFSKPVTKNESELTKGTIQSKSNCLSLNKTTENNVCEEKSNINDGKLFPEINKITNGDIKEVLKNLNCHFDLSTKSSYVCNTNDLHDTYLNLKYSKNNTINKSSLLRSETKKVQDEFHDEFQAELSTLDQLNDSLHDIEKMSSAMSTKTDDYSIVDEPNDHSITNDFNSKVILNSGYSNKIKPTPVSKLNALSLNMMSIDKTITCFSIQMFEQLIKDEELRAKQHQTILNLRERSLINRLKWEVTICELQMKNIKNRLGLHDKHLQTLKQKQRGSVKKLEHSLSQVKRLGRVIDSVYKQRLTTLKEHLQYLRTLSSSKNVIRKLKSLDQVPKKEDYARGSLNSNLFKQCDKSDLIDTIDKEHCNMNTCEFNLSSKNNTSQTMIESHKSNIILQNQATSPINTETKSLKIVENIKVQTDGKRSLQFSNNKYTQTSKLVCNYVNNENKKPLTCYVSSENTFSDVKTTDKISQLAVLPTNPTKTKQYISETSNSTNSEQSDMDVRITTLQEKLEARKMESFKLKKEQKKLRSENLKAKEQDLLKQIELYDKKIEESKKSLLVEIEKKKIQLKHESSSKRSKYSILQNIIKNDSDHAVDKLNEHFHSSDRTMWVDGNKFFYPIERKKSINQNFSSPEKPVNGQTNVIKSNSNHDKCTNNHDLEDIDGQPQFQSIETNCCEVVLLPKDLTATEIKTLKESDEIQTDINNIVFKSQPINDLVESLIKETQSNKCNGVNDTNVISLSDCSVQNLKMPDISSNQELYLEKNTCTDKLSVSYGNINNNHSSSSSSSISNSQRKLFEDFNENNNNLCEKNGSNVNALEVSNNEIEVHNDYSLDFTLDENTSECQKLNELGEHNNIIELPDKEQNSESSYEEERSEGDVMFEDKTFIEHFSDDSYLVLNGFTASDKVDAITNNIFNCLLKDTKKALKSNMSKTFNCPKKNDLNNLTEETPLLMILKREEEHQRIVFLSEQATTISNDLLKRNLHQILSEILPQYLPRFNELQMEKLKVYLNWSSSKRKKLKLPKCLNYQNKTNDVDNTESFEIFYQKYQDQKESPTSQDESSDVMLCQTQQEAEKLKLEQIRIEEEIESLRISEEAQFVQRNIPKKPPPPYKSPTKKKSLIDIPYTSDEIYKIVLTAASQLFNESQLSMLNDYIIDTDSCLHTDYKTLIFDYCKEVAQETFIDEKNIPIWKKNVKKLKNFRSRPRNPEDLSDIVIKRINQIIDIDECEEKVNKFVVKQMHEEDSKWFDFQKDEMEIQNDIVESLMQKLLCDTITNIKTSFYLKFKS